MKDLWSCVREKKKLKAYLYEASNIYLITNLGNFSSWSIMQKEIDRKQYEA